MILDRQFKALASAGTLDEVVKVVVATFDEVDVAEEAFGDIVRARRERTGAKGGDLGLDVAEKLGEALPLSLVDAWKRRLGDEASALRAFVEDALVRVFSEECARPDATIAEDFAAALRAAETPDRWFDVQVISLSRALATDPPSGAGAGLRDAVELVLLTGYAMRQSVPGASDIVADFGPRFRGASTVEAWLVAGVDLVAAAQGPDELLA